LILSVLLISAVVLLGFANGANDNFKGVASLYGSGTASYGHALSWATLATGAGSIASFFLAQALLHKFTGKGLAPESIVTSPAFVLAVATGAALTVLQATRFGFPISTTHALLGAMIGSGWTAAGFGALRLGALGQSFVLPLLLSPLLAMAGAAALHFLASTGARRLGWRPASCVCVGLEFDAIAVPAGSLAAATAVLPAPRIYADSSVATCAQREIDLIAATTLGRVRDGLHWLSAGAVSFARGLNDTPKMAAVLLMLRWLEPRWDVLGVAAAIAVGGWVAARRVAETMGHRITKLDHGQGLTSNLVTASLVIVASVFGLPVSTTHVATGSLFGVGIVNRTADPRAVTGIVLAWIITLPCAALASSLVYFVTRPLLG